MKRSTENRIRSFQNSQGVGEGLNSFLASLYLQCHQPDHYFLFLITCTRAKLAKFFWEMGDEPITSALSATFLCNRMYLYVPKYLHSIRQDFLSMRK